MIWWRFIKTINYSIVRFGYSVGGKLYTFLNRETSSKRRIDTKYKIE